MKILSLNGYLAPEMEVIDIKAEGVICTSGTIPALSEDSEFKF